MLSQFVSNAAGILDNKAWLTLKNEHIKFVQNRLKSVQILVMKICIVLFLLKTTPVALNNYSLCTRYTLLNKYKTRDLQRN